MRKKSITLLVCIYAALCISYTVVSSAMIPDSSDTLFTAVQESSQTSAQNNPSEGSKSTVKEKSSVSETESSSATSKNESSGAIKDINDTEQENDEYEITQTPEIIIEQSETKVSESDTNNEDENTYYYEPEDPYSSPSDTEEPSEEVIDSYSEDEESQEEINDEDHYQEEKPTLAEFLSGLRCSGCRHNCSLLSPRCMNGARKASQAESTYYSTYGS